ncbi:hypothetical protein Ae717Ps2_6549c [Pseudonocardia sp. Ae717_Ps2]|nr:hypothetical protein Ae717Ps2_6549c [Pseudonocardia sp. Ae717_Ps2]
MTGGECACSDALVSAKRYACRGISAVLVVAVSMGSATGIAAADVSAVGVHLPRILLRSPCKAGCPAQARIVDLMISSRSFAQSRQGRLLRRQPRLFIQMIQRGELNISDL